MQAALAFFQIDSCTSGVGFDEYSCETCFDTEIKVSSDSLFKQLFNERRIAFRVLFSPSSSFLLQATFQVMQKKFYNFACRSPILMIFMFLEMALRFICCSSLLVLAYF